MESVGKPWAPGSSRAEEGADGTHTSAGVSQTQEAAPNCGAQEGRCRDGVRREGPDKDRDQKFGFFSEWDGGRHHLIIKK